MRTPRPAATSRTMTLRLGTERSGRRPDTVATEEPLEIRVHGPGREPVAAAVTMRTPGHDFELAVGYLFTERILTAPSQLREVKYCVRANPENETGEAPTQEYNIVTVALSHDVPEERLRRATLTSSSCGLCGTDSIEHLATDVEPITAAITVDTATVLALPDRLRAHQPLFDSTGGLHGVGIFTPDGDAVVVREDVGRHNALDKVIGQRVLAGTDGDGHVLVVSGRVSFEIVQKAVAGRLSVIVAVGAPTSLAISAAERLGVTLVGFVTPRSANVYSRPERITGP